MRVLRLEAENFKRLRAITIVPGRHVVEVTGMNGEGKSSTLDAIWALVGGKDAAPDKPIRSGEEAATITALLGEGSEVKLKVTRRFKLREGVPYTTDLIVESGEGARFSSPQSILDTLVGTLCFDPLAFTLMKDEEQIKELRAFVPEVNFPEIEGLNRRDYEDRTEVNRKAQELRAQAAALPPVEDGASLELVDLGGLETRLAEAAQANGLTEQRRARRVASEERIAAIKEQIATLTSEMEAMQSVLANAEPLPEMVDSEDLARQLAEGRQTNVLVERTKRRKELDEAAAAAEARSAALTAAIDKRTEDAAKAVAAAKMPVPGLGFGKDFVTFQGEPLGQASRAEQIRVSVAIAAAMNPQLQVARILDGSLLDAKSWKALEQYAAEADLQIWVETVSQHGVAAVHIADGGIASSLNAEQPAAEVGDVV